MVKKWFCVTTLLVFAFVFTMFTVVMNTPLRAQEEEQVEDVMDISLEDLLDVEITTASRKVEKVGQVPASVVVITREDIERYGYRSLKEVIENVPGIYHINDMSYYGDSFGMRGFFSQAQRNIIFMVNGVHQFDGFWKVSFLENFSMPIEAIDRIEVVRGPMSVIYGSGAFFGAINIFTNLVESEKTHNIVSVSGGSESTFGAGAKFAGKTGDFNYAFSAGYFDTQGPNVPLSTMSSYDLSDFGIDSTNNTTEKRLEHDNKYFNLSLDYKGFYGKMSFSQSQKENYIVIPSVSDGTKTLANFTTVAFGYRRDFSDKFTLDTSLAYHKHNWWATFDLFDPSFYGYEFTKSEEIELDLTTIFTPSEAFNITTGLHFSRVPDLTAFDLVPPFEYNQIYFVNDPIDTTSLFMQADITPSQWLRFVAGLRIEQLAKYEIGASLFTSLQIVPDAEVQGLVENDKVQFIPRVAAIISLNDKNFMKFLYGKAIRHPEYQPNIENLIFGGLPTLESEYINTFEFNYITSPSPALTLNLSLFYNRLQNLIVRQLGFDSTGSLFTFYSNIGDLETLGGELSIIANPFKGFFLDLSGTYQKTKDLREEYKDIDVSYSPKLLAHLKASYKMGEFAIGVTGRYVDKMKPKFDVLENAFIGAEIDSHFILDSNLRIGNLFGQGYFIAVRVNNLFDTEYLYPANENTNLFADKGVIGRGVGRTFIVTIGKKFMP